MKSSFSLGKKERLRRGADFQKVFSQGKLFKSPLFLFYVLKMSPPSPGLGKVGFVVSRKVGGAVTRNRVRRLLREAYRQSRGQLKEGNTLVLVARKGARNLSFRETREVLHRLFVKAGLFKGEIRDE